MPDKEQAGTANEPTPDEVQSNKAATESVSEAIDQEQDRIADLEARLTKAGRLTKTQEKQLSDAQERLKELEDRESKLLAANKKWEEAFYSGRTATDEDRRRYQEQKAQQAQQKSGASVNEAALWREIAGEEDPKLRTALKGIAERAAKSGRYPDPDTIRAFKESFQTFTAPGDESEEKKPIAKVTATSTTSNTSSSLQEKYEEAKKRKDVDEMFRIKSQIEAAKLRSARG